MRIDLPLCSFKECRHQFDGNCVRKNRETCEFHIHKTLLEECAEEIEDLNGRETELTEKIHQII